MKLVFEIDHPGDMDAGFMSYSDVVTVTIDSGYPGGNEGEFKNELLSFLRDWYEGASISVTEVSQ